MPQQERGVLEVASRSRESVWYAAALRMSAPNGRGTLTVVVVPAGICSLR